MEVLQRIGGSLDFNDVLLSSVHLTAYQNVIRALSHGPKKAGELTHVLQETYKDALKNEITPKSYSGSTEVQRISSVYSNAEIFADRVLKLFADNSAIEPVSVSNELHYRMNENGKEI